MGSAFDWMQLIWCMLAGKGLGDVPWMAAAALVQKFTDVLGKQRFLTTDFERRISGSS